MTAPRRDLILRPIGVIRSPHLAPAGTPIQPVYAERAEGQVLVDEAFVPALADLEGFERVWLLYWLDRAGPFTPRVVPYRDTREHGLFATRSPCRPNPIGLSAVRLLGREGRVLHVADLDILDGTPLLDIKPFVRRFDEPDDIRIGWLEGKADNVDSTEDDGRFDSGEN